MKRWIGVAGIGCLFFAIMLMNINAKGKKGFSSVQTGESAPAFSLTDINGKSHSLSDYKGKYVVLEWVNHGCPYVKKHYDTGNMQGLQDDMTKKGVVWLSICSSAEGKQGHMSLASWKETTKQKGASPTAILLDEKGDVGRLYGAKTTPHMFIISPEGEIAYQGAIDDKASTSKADVKGAKNFVRVALSESMDGKPISSPQTSPYGCSVKY